MADVFITHGGINSVSEAMVIGTPMVVIPFVSDQPVNAECMERLGVGKRLKYADVNKGSLKSMVLSVLTDAVIKNNISKVQQLINDAPGNKGGAEMIVTSQNNY